MKNNRPLPSSGRTPRNTTRPLSIQFLSWSFWQISCQIIGSGPNPGVAPPPPPPPHLPVLGNPGSIAMIVLGGDFN